MTKLVKCDQCERLSHDSGMYFTVNSTPVYSLSGNEPTHFCSRLCVGLYYLRAVTSHGVRKQDRETAIESLEEAIAVIRGQEVEVRT